MKIFLYVILVAFNKLQHVYQVAVGRVIFKAWHTQALDAKLTREYFEVCITLQYNPT